MHSRFGIDTVYIVGGSARSVLDATYGFQRLKMRDLDLFAVSNTRGRATRTLTGRLARQLAGLGYHKHPLENRLRGDPTRGKRGINNNAGYGFFLDRPGDETVVDISLLHSPAALQLNGPLNIDRIKIPIRAGQSLIDVWKQMRGKPYHHLVQSGVVQDQDKGYIGWRTGRLKLVNPGDIWADVERMKPRLVKSFLKAGARMPRALVRQLRAMPQQRARDPELELRYTQRVLELPLEQAAQGLTLLRKLRAPALNDPRVTQSARYRQVAAHTARAVPRRWPDVGKTHKVPQQTAAAISAAR